MDAALALDFSRAGRDFSLHVLVSLCEFGRHRGVRQSIELRNPRVDDPLLQVSSAGRKDIERDVRLFGEVMGDALLVGLHAHRDASRA
jgi:hypothetical protein